MSNTNSNMPLEKITLQCSCIEPHWRLDGTSIECTSCKKVFELDPNLLNLIKIQTIKSNIGIDSIYYEFDSIAQQLNRMRSILDFSTKIKQENDQLFNNINQLKESIRNLEQKNRELSQQNSLLLKEQQSECIDLRSVIKSVLEYESALGRALIEHGNDLVTLRNRIETQSEKLEYELGNSGIKIRKHDCGSKPEGSLRSDVLEIMPIPTEDKNLDGTVKIVERYGCDFPDNSNIKSIPEKIELWKYKSNIEFKIKLISNNSSNSEVQLNKKEGEFLYLSDYSEAFDPDEGYHFIGWSTDSIQTNLSDEAIEVNSDLTLYALWSNTHSLTIHYSVPSERYAPVQDRVLKIKKGETIIIPYNGANGLCPENPKFTSKSDVDEVINVDLVEQRNQIKVGLEKSYCLLYENNQYQSEFTILDGSDIDLNTIEANAVPIMRLANISLKNLDIYDEDSVGNYVVNIEFDRNSLNDELLEKPLPINSSTILDLGPFKLAIPCNKEHAYSVNEKKIRFALESCYIYLQSDKIAILKVTFTKLARVFWSTNCELNKIEYCKFGTTANYDIPLRKPFKDRAYFFDCWNPVPRTIEGDITFSAQYTSMSYQDAIKKAIADGNQTEYTIKRCVKVECFDKVIAQMIKQNIIVETKESKGKKTTVIYQLK